jgi:hypothetical protein
VIRRILSFLYGSEPMVFATELPVDKAVASLRAATAKSALHSLTREAATGTVSGHKVSLQRAIPLVGNSFKPFFVGRFSSESSKTLLKGVFTIHWVVKVFMTFWLGFCALWTVLALVAAVAKPTEMWFFPLAGVGMLFVGTGIVRLGKWFSRNDQKYLCEVIERALLKDAT